MPRVDSARQSYVVLRSQIITGEANLSPGLAKSRSHVQAMCWRLFQLLCLRLSPRDGTTNNLTQRSSCSSGNQRYGQGPSLHREKRPKGMKGKSVPYFKAQLVRSNMLWVSKDNKNAFNSFPQNIIEKVYPSEVSSFSLCAQHLSPGQLQSFDQHFRIKTVLIETKKNIFSIIRAKGLAESESFH